MGGQHKSGSRAYRIGEWLGLDDAKTEILFSKIMCFKDALKNGENPKIDTYADELPPFLEFQLSFRTTALYQKLVHKLLRHER